MSPEKPRSIQCEICKGWHTTEAHAQYETEAREKRMAEIKTRPDSAYHFDTLGFTPEQKGEIEPWMHTVIEKAKELGDDLQDSDNYLHLEWSGDEDRFRLFKSIITNGFFEPRRHEEIQGHPHTIRGGEFYAQPHAAGNEFKFWKQNPIIKDMLVTQERYLATRDPLDLEAYKKSIRRLRSWAKHEKLDTPEQRRRIVEELIGNHYGVILAFPDKLKSDPELIVKDDPEDDDFFEVWNTNPKVKLVKYPRPYQEDLEDEGPENDAIFFGMEDPRHKPHHGIVHSLIDISAVSNQTLRRLSSAILHGLFVSGGVENQREVLNHMLQKTSADPEKRLPMYNFYGKLVWPRPPKEDE